MTSQNFIPDQPTPPTPDSVARKVLLEMHLEESPYSAHLITPPREGSFLTLAGAKKGSRFQGGGISISNLRTFDNLLALIGVVNTLRLPSCPTETRVAFCNEKTRFLSGETKNFKGNWFYRIKVYRNFFRDKETGNFVNLKGQELRPAGHGFFIQELDIPISPEGKAFACEFSSRLTVLIGQLLSQRFPCNGTDVPQLTREEKVLADGDLPWITSAGTSDLIQLPEPLTATICRCLLDDPHNEESLASKLNITQNLAGLFTNYSARYCPEFLSRDIVIDRIRGPHGNLLFQATQIPVSATAQSPRFGKLLSESDGQWPVWKRVTFSNDQFPQGKLASLWFARFEVNAFCGGVDWGVPIDDRKARATALRLFDLKLHYKKQSAESEEIQRLAIQFQRAVNEH